MDFALTYRFPPNAAALVSGRSRNAQDVEHLQHAGGRGRAAPDHVINEADGLGRSRAQRAGGDGVDTDLVLAASLKCQHPRVALQGRLGTAHASTIACHRTHASALVIPTLRSSTFLVCHYYFFSTVIPCFTMVENLAKPKMLNFFRHLSHKLFCMWRMRHDELGACDWMLRCERGTWDDLLRCQVGERDGGTPGVHDGAEPLHHGYKGVRGSTDCR